MSCNKIDSCGWNQITRLCGKTIVMLLMLMMLMMMTKMDWWWKQKEIKSPYFSWASTIINFSIHNYDSQLKIETATQTLAKTHTLQRTCNQKQTLRSCTVCPRLHQWIHQQVFSLVFVKRIVFALICMSRRQSVCSWSCCSCSLLVGFSSCFCLVIVHAESTFNLSWNYSICHSLIISKSTRNSQWSARPKRPKTLFDTKLFELDYFCFECGLVDVIILSKHFKKHVQIAMSKHNIIIFKLKLLWKCW